MTDLFSPNRADGRAEWRVIYDKMKDASYGAEIGFAEIAELLESDDRDRAHRAVRRCNQQFMREGKPKILGNVRGTGYRVLMPGEYAPHAVSYQDAARRKLSTAVDLIRTAPVGEMTDAERNWASQVTMVLIDNELRLRSQEQWRKDAERRLQELERRSGLAGPGTVNGEITE